ncbi:hypothetical protein GH714_028403 [Hevea brasiliensis]|uniref:RNase H type-1 domain-containing protein n=1 Tax=Hevea brasiliensis TaxID=3981 RepID=A0A6A6MI46_HEVBR|nr:hypothetical protein GH714_028403 [Hevea brasiliensis]
MDAVMSSSGLVQLGVVFRDEIGNVLASAIKCIFGSWTSDISEALAIAFGLRLVVELSFPHIIAESNCQHLIGLLQAKETPHSPLRKLSLSQIDPLFGRFGSKEMVEVERTQNPWVSAEQISRVEINGHDMAGERAISAAGAAFLSAIIVNPLDVAKTRLQAQAAGVPYSHPLSNITSRMAYFGPNMMFADLRCSPSCTRAGIHGTVSICPPDCFQYKGTLDVFYKIIRQEGIARLWRGTNAALALAVPTVGIYLPCYDVFRNWMEDFSSQNIPGATPYVPLVAGSLARSLACATCYPVELARTRMQAFKAAQISKPPGVWKTLLEVLSNVRSTNNVQNNLGGYRVLWTGMGAQLARDVPFSAICWSILEPKDPVRALRMTTRQVLLDIWRDGGVKALFIGVGPRVGRAGPSVGIVVSFYEVVKYVLHRQSFCKCFGGSIFAVRVRLVMDFDVQG